MQILVSNDDGILAPGLALLADVCQTVGQVTSAAVSPRLGRTVALARLSSAHAESGTRLCVRGVPATVTEAPP